MLAHVLVSGFVQGVGYRRFIRHHALKISLAGWVKNLPDNRVEAVFQGSKEKIEEMIRICKKGPFLSEVKGIQVEWEEKMVDDIDSFKIAY
jgi:acylphosphatase